MNPGYQALREHAAWLDLSSRGKIRVTGEDRARLLHAMATQHIEQLKPGEGAYTFFLNAQGRILLDANVFCFEDHFLLDTEPETREKLYQHLDHFIIADDVTLADETNAVATIAIEGPEAEASLAKLGGPIPAQPYSTAAWGDRTVARVNTTGADPGSGGFFILVPASRKAALESELSGVPQASAGDARIVRIEHGRPRYGDEITERYLVQETDQLRAVHFSKGCYLGQEIVERVRSRAQIHRILRRVEIETAEVPAAGTKLKSGDADAAEIASAVYSPALQKTVALAYVRVPFSEPGTALSLGGAAARILQ